jgi:hypothetical protein
MVVNCVSVLCFLFAVISAVHGQHTDLKEYGLKGKVKNITTYHYKDVMFSNGHWMPVAYDKYSYITIWHVNEEGFMDTTITKLVVHPDSLSSSMLIYEMDNGKKVSGKYYSYRGIQTEQYQITWTDQYTYTMIATDTNGVKTWETTSWLNQDFRDSKGEYKSYENGKVVFQESYSDSLDQSGRLVEAEFDQVTDNKKYVVLYKHSEFDHYNNPLETTQINGTDGTIKKMTIRRIEYYE